MLMEVKRAFINSLILNQKNFKIFHIFLLIYFEMDQILFYHRKISNNHQWIKKIL